MLYKLVLNNEIPVDISFLQTNFFMNHCNSSYYIILTFCPPPSPSSLSPQLWLQLGNAMRFEHKQEGHPCIYFFYLALPILGMNPLASSPHPTTFEPLLPSPLDLISDVPSLAFALAYALALSSYSLSFAMSGTGG